MTCILLNPPLVWYLGVVLSTSFFLQCMDVCKADMRVKVIENQSSEAEVNHLAGSAAGLALLVFRVCGTGTLVSSSR